MTNEPQLNEPAPDLTAIRAELRDRERADRERQLLAGRPSKPRNRREWALWRQGHGLTGNDDDDPGAA